jgi:hypothetical protein
MSVLGAGGAARDAGRIGRHYASRAYNHQFQDHGPTSPGVAAFSSASSDSYDSDGGEVLPLAPTAHNNTGAGSHTHPVKTASLRLWALAKMESGSRPLTNDISSLYSQTPTRAGRSMLGARGGRPRGLLLVIRMGAPWVPQRIAKTK